MKAAVAFSPAVVVVIAAACGTSLQSGEGDTSSVTFAISGGDPTADFSGNSVLICGSRMPPADAKYLCNSTLSSEDGSDCTCFNFAADGSLIDPTTGMPAVVNDLCPSVDVTADAATGAPPVDWTFTYAVFDSTDCNGVQLNGGSNNFTCFDSHDLGTQEHPNASVEVLDPGPNTNHVICVTVNASKTFDFTSCAQSCNAPSDALPGPGCIEILYECGCTPSDDTCLCGPDGGLTAALLPSACIFNLPTCDILCEVPPDAGAPDSGVTDASSDAPEEPDVGSADAAPSACPDSGVVGPINPVTGATIAGVPIPDAGVATSDNLGFLVVVEDDATLVANQNEGTMAIGGDLTIDGSYEIVNQAAFGGSGPMGGFVFPGDSSNTALLVGHQVNLAGSNAVAVLQIDNNGWLKIGDITNGVSVRDTDNNNATNLTHVVPSGPGGSPGDYDGVPRIQLNSEQPASTVAPKPNLINFAALFPTYDARSNELATCQDNVTLTDSTGTPLTLPLQEGTTAFITLTGGRTNVLNVSPQNLNNIETLNFQGELPSASTPLLINVVPPPANMAYTWVSPTTGGIGSAQAPFILWNFPGVTVLSRVDPSGAVEGTIFAPLAELNDTASTDRAGNIVSAGLTLGTATTGGEVLAFPFATTLTCVCNAGASTAADSSTSSEVPDGASNTAVGSSTATGSDTAAGSHTPAGPGAGCGCHVGRRPQGFPGSGLVAVLGLWWAAIWRRRRNAG